MGLEPAFEHACIRACGHSSTLSDTNIFKTSGPITIKFCLKELYGKEKAAIGLGLAWFKTLVYSYSLITR